MQLFLLLNMLMKHKLYKFFQINNIQHYILYNHHLLNYIQNILLMNKMNNQNHLDNIHHYILNMHLMFDYKLHNLVYLNTLYKQFVILYKIQKHMKYNKLQRNMLNMMPLQKNMLYMHLKQNNNQNYNPYKHLLSQRMMMHIELDKQYILMPLLMNMFLIHNLNKLLLLH